MKKWNLLGVLFALIICFTACDDNNAPTNKDITVESQTQLTQTVFADDTNGKSGVNFTTTGAWSSTITEAGNITLKSTQSSPDWISITPDSGKEAGDYTIEINLSENLTGSDRSATIEIICGETTITISISQKGTKEDGTLPGEHDPKGGSGLFTLVDYYSGREIGKADVDEARVNRNQINFYKEGESVGIYLQMSDLASNSYDWCDYGCSGNYFYTQKGVTGGIIWYATKGEVRLSKQDNKYTIEVFIDANQDYVDNYNARLDIRGTYTGYLTIED